MLNSIRKAFYLFLELIPKTDSNGKILAEFFLLTNQIRKDLEHPNEFFRAVVMNTISKIALFDNKKTIKDCLEPLSQPIEKNLRNMHFYTRRNALIAYHSGYNYEQEQISEMMQKENNTQLLRLCYACLEKNQINLSEDSLRIGPLTYSVKTIPDDLLMDVLKKTQSSDLLLKCIEIGKMLPFSYFTLLQNFPRFPSNMVLSLIEIVEDPVYKEIGLKVIQKNLQKIRSELNVSNFIPLLDCDCKEVLFQIIDTIKKPIDREIIKKKLRDEISHDYFDEDYLVFILEKYSELINNRSLKGINDSQITHVQNKLRYLATGDNPRTAYAALPLCENLIGILPNIQFGKVFRKAVNLVMTDPENYAKFLELCKKEEFLEKHVANFGIISMALFKIAFLDNIQDRSEILQILVQMLDIGKSDINFDYTTYEVVSQVFNDVLNGDLHTQKGIVSRKEKKTREKSFFLPFLPHEEQNVQIEHTQSKKIIKQLSGYTDPLYVEAMVEVTRLKISLELLVINTTSHMITNILPEFTVSPNISSDRTFSFNLDKQSIIKKEYSLRVNEVVNGFLTGHIQFSIGKNMHMSISLGEIQFKVNEYLLEKNISQDDFKGSWITLEWENSYTSRFRSSLEVNGVFDRIKNALKCSVIDIIPSTNRHSNFIVANLCCTTLLAEDILLNLKISKENTAVTVDCRMRSASEKIVKSLSVVFGECLRGIKE